MLDDQLINKTKKVSRRYILLDNSPNKCIIDYVWSNVEPDGIIKNIIWNDYYITTLRSSFRDGKYVIGVF